ncbi:MAG: peptide deformylase [Actinobacteria bacterium]|nr:peptide deformylase [Actinomycetota bacterium]
MKQTLNATRDPEGVGLAAPQVGKSFQLFITKPTQKSRIQIFINPVIISKNHKKQNIEEQKPAKKSVKSRKGIKLEGCLSLPNIWGEVERSNEVELSYLDEKGREHVKVFTGFPATIIQHEYDHLQGTLFPKRVLEQKRQLYKSKKNEKGEDEFEEIEI